MKFYDALVIAMEQKQMRPADICAKTDLNDAYFSKLKSGHMKTVTWEKGLAIIAALGMTPDEFLAIQESDENGDS